MKSLDEIARLLCDAGVPYALIGGHAVNVVVEPRFTADIDVTISADSSQLGLLHATLLAAGFSVEREHGAALPSGPDFIRFVDGDGTKLELQMAKTALQRSVIARARDHGGVRVATPEDLIVLKAIANRPKDQVDLLALSRLATIDWVYVDVHAREWGVEAVVAHARALSATPS